VSLCLLVLLDDALLRELPERAPLLPLEEYPLVLVPREDSVLRRLLFPAIFSSFSI